MMFLTGADRSVVSPHDFRAEMIARLQAARPDVTLVADPDDALAIIIMIDGVAAGAYNLHQLEDYCQRASKSDCEINKADYVAQMSIDAAPPTRASLRLAVRDESYLALIEEFAAAKPDSRELTRPRQIGDDLYAFLAADSETKVSLINDKTLKELGLSGDEAWALAAAQTRAILPGLPTPDRLATAAVMFEDQDYLASLLIDLPGWAEIAAKVGPDLFVSVVADRIVYAGVLPDGPAFDDFKKAVAEDCAALQKCISPHVYRLRDGRWAIAR